MKFDHEKVNFANSERIERSRVPHFQAQRINQHWPICFQSKNITLQILGKVPRLRRRSTLTQFQKIFPITLNPLPGKIPFIKTLHIKVTAQQLIDQRITRRQPVRVQERATAQKDSKTGQEHQERTKKVNLPRKRHP
jgi:hypothetical protein